MSENNNPVENDVTTAEGTEQAADATAAEGTAATTERERDPRAAMAIGQTMPLPGRAEPPVFTDSSGGGGAAVGAAVTVLAQMPTTRSMHRAAAQTT